MKHMKSSQLLLHYIPNFEERGLKAAKYSIEKSLQEARKKNGPRSCDGISHIERTGDSRGLALGCKLMVHFGQNCNPYRYRLQLCVRKYFQIKNNIKIKQKNILKPDKIAVPRMFVCLF